MEKIKPLLKSVIGVILFLTIFTNSGWATPTITNVAVTNATCTDNGQIEITATGNGTLTYILLDFLGPGMHRTQVGDNKFMGLWPRSYAIEVYETGNPTPATASATITSNYQQLVQGAASGGISQTDICAGGYITLNWENGRSPFSVTVTNTNSPFNTQAISTNNQTHTFSGLPNGSYSFRVEDACHNSFNSTQNIVIDASSGFSLAGVSITNVVWEPALSANTISGVLGQCNILNFTFHWHHILIYTPNNPTGIIMYALPMDALNTIAFGIEYPANSGIIQEWNTFANNGTYTGLIAKINNYAGSDNPAGTPHQQFRVAVKNPCTGEITYSIVNNIPPLLGFRITEENVPKVDYCTEDPTVIVDLNTSNTGLILYACRQPYTVELYESGTNQLISTKTAIVDPHNSNNLIATFSPYNGDSQVATGKTYYAIIRGSGGWTQTTRDTTVRAMTLFKDRIIPTTIYSGAGANQLNYRDCDYNTTALGWALGGIGGGIPVVEAGRPIYFLLAGKTGTPTEGITRSFNSNGHSTTVMWNDIPWGEYELTAVASCTTAVFSVNSVQQVDNLSAEMRYTGTAVCGFYNISGKAWFSLAGTPITGTSGQPHLFYSMRITDAPIPALIGVTSLLGINGMHSNSSIDNILTNVTPGTYKALFFPSYMSPIEQKSCLPEVTIVIPEYAPPLVDVYNSGGYICGEGTDKLHITMAQGTQLPLLYRWKGMGTPDGAYSPYQLNNVFSDMPLGSYTDKVQDACNYTVTQNVHILGSGDQIAEVEGNVQSGVLCGTREVVLHARSVGPVNKFIWEKEIAGSWITLVEGKNASTYTIPFATESDLGSYRLTIETASGCTIESPVPITFSTLVPPPAAPSIAGLNVICSGGGSVALTASSSDSSYRWYKDGTLINNAESKTYTATAAGSYTVVTIPANGCPSDPSAAHVIEIGTLPAQPDSITGDATVCKGNTKTYSVTNAADTDTYLWSVPSGWTITSNPQNTNSITVSVTSSAVSGNISVTPINHCGNGQVRQLPVTVAGQPVSTPDAENNSRCGTGAVELTATGAGAGESYIWFNASETQVSTSNPFSPIVTAGNTDTYYVTVINTASGCETNALRKEVKATAYNAFQTGGIASGSTKICSDDNIVIKIISTAVASGGDGNISYQWYKSVNSATATLISSSTEASYTLPTSSPDRINNSKTDIVIVYTRKAKDTTCSAFTASSGSYTLTVTPKVVPKVRIRVGD